MVQAGIYWLLARRWVAQRPMPIGLALTYRALSVGDVAFLLAGLIGVIVWLPDQPLLALAVLAVWAFGVIEFVHYYLVRLGYPVGRWLTRVGQRRSPRLALDISQGLQSRGRTGRPRSAWRGGRLTGRGRWIPRCARRRSRGHLAHEG